MEHPPGGFRYFVPETRIQIEGQTWQVLLDNVRKHLKVNSIPERSDLEGNIQHQICLGIPPDRCQDTDAQAKRAKERGFRVSFGAAWEFTKLMFDWKTRYGGALAAVTEAEGRATVCCTSGEEGIPCPFNRPIECTSCSLGTLQTLTEKLVNGRRTSRDNELHGCSICGCNLKAKVHLPHELLAEHAGDTLSNFPAHCWMLKEQTNGN